MSYTFGEGTQITVPQGEEFPCKIGDLQYQTSRARTLSGALVTSQGFGGVAMLSVDFRLVANSVKTQLLAFLETVRGALYPFFYQDHDGAVYFLTMIADYTPLERFRYGLNNVSLVMQAAVIGTVSSPIYPPGYRPKTDPSGNIELDPEGRPILVPYS